MRSNNQEMKLIFTVAFSICFLVLSSNASQRCNLYNFGVKGAFPCALEWWNAEDLGQIVTFDPRLSDLVLSVFNTFNITQDVLNQTFYGYINATSDDPFSKIVESGATVEPFITYAISDLIKGQSLTAAELSQFGLPASLTQSATLMEMYKNYFDLSCTDSGVRPVVSCIQTWLDSNCLDEDEPAVITQFMNRMRDEYCSGSNAKSGLITMLNNDLGSVFSSLLDFMGIYKTSGNMYLYGLRDDSIFFNSSLWENLGRTLEADCSYLVQSLTADLPILITDNSTAGAGFIIDRLIGFANQASKCVLRGWEKHFPNFLEDHSKAISHLEIVGKRYSLESINTDPTDVATVERASVIVYGDPHMLTYKATRSQTCAAAGWRTYLNNEYFKLTAFAEAACNTCQATYVTMVNISFIGLSDQVQYITGAGNTPSNQLLVNGIASASTGEIKLADFGESIQVTDERSGAVFGFRKYRHTYYFTVRMGVNLFDASLGLLITGCPDEMDVTIDSTGRKRRQNSACEEACANVPEPELYLDSCIFDCDMTGDINVAQISEGAVALEQEVEAEDEKIYKTLGVTTTTLSSSGVGFYQTNGIVTLLMSAILPLHMHMM